MKFSNVRYFGEDCRIHYGDVETDGESISRVTPRAGEVPEKGPLLSPGFVDIHLHGNSGADFSDGNDESNVKMARFLAGIGVTSFSATTMTLPEKTMVETCRAAARLHKEAPEGAARLRGVTLEGPFFNAKRKGAQAAEYLRLPDFDLFERLQAAADGLIRIACVAPELDGAEAFIRAVSQTGVRVSEAHTDANYDAAAAGFAAGARHVTHLFNAMPPLLHRAPGVIGAASEREDVTAELICDGVHIHPSAVKAAFKLFGPERICLISDAMSAAGMPDGAYSLGGQPVTVRDGRATLADGTIAGSVATVPGCVRKAVAFGIPPEQALRCATVNPARVIGADDIGAIAPGKRADLLMLDDELAVQAVYIGAKQVR
jgi:N-acetylglucosamine-6-phosphate deacetylase